MFYSSRVSYSFWTQTPPPSPRLHDSIFPTAARLTEFYSTGTLSTHKGGRDLPVLSSSLSLAAFRSIFFPQWQFRPSRNWVCRYGGLEMRCTAAGQGAHNVCRWALSAWPCLSLSCSLRRGRLPFRQLDRARSSLSFPASNIPRKENPSSCSLGIIPFSTTQAQFSF